LAIKYIREYTPEAEAPEEEAEEEDDAATTLGSCAG
jgi:hypothetical protein